MMGELVKDVTGGAGKVANLGAIQVSPAAFRKPW